MPSTPSSTGAGAAALTSVAAGRYRLERMLGEGSKKQVYLAHDTRLDRAVALALFKTAGLDRDGQHRIQREAQALGQHLSQTIKTGTFRVFSTITWRLLRVGPCTMERFPGVRAAVLLGITEHVQGDAVVDVLLSAHAIDRLLHFAVAPIPPFHGVRGGRQEFVIKKRQRLVQVGRAQLGQDRADFLETVNLVT
jgi:hypothetical protein